MDNTYQEDQSYHWQTGGKGSLVLRLKNSLSAETIHETQDFKPDSSSIINFLFPETDLETTKQEVINGL